MKTVLDNVIPSEQTNVFMEIYPWLLEQNPLTGNLRLSDLGALAGKYWITGDKCPTWKLAMAVDAIERVPVLAAMIAAAMDIRVSDGLSSPQIREKVISTILVRIAKSRE